MSSILGAEDDIRKLIEKRRRQVVIHSCIYYVFNTSIIPDSLFDKWAYELVGLQEKYPEIAKYSDWAYEFKDFDGNTGYDLPLRGKWVIGKSQQLLDYANKEG